MDRCTRLVDQYVSITFVNVEIKYQLEQYESYFVCFAYNPRNYSLKHQVWVELQSLVPIESKPWCIIGYFNDITHQTEKSGNIPVYFIESNCFVNFMTFTGVVDLWGLRSNSLGLINALVSTTFKKSWIEQLPSTIPKVWQGV